MKPFFFDTFRERLEKYAALRGRMRSVREADQVEIDRLYSLLCSQGGRGLPKGISAPTLALGLEVAGGAEEELTAAEGPSVPASVAGRHAGTSSSSRRPGRSS